jgi:hypothetical protein
MRKPTKAVLLRQLRVMDREGRHLASMLNSVYDPRRQHGGIDEKVLMELCVLTSRLFQVEMTLMGKTKHEMMVETKAQVDKYYADIN